MGSRTSTIGLHTGKVFLSPASPALTEAFRSAQIQASDRDPTTFSMTFQLKRTELGADYELLLGSTFAAYSRVCLTANTAKQNYVLLDGLITSTELTQGSGNTPDTIVVQGRDLTAAMDLHEKSIPWPCMNDSAIVLALLAQYAIYGMVPITVPTVFSASQGPGEVTQQQRGTDYQHISSLASRNGYIFRVIPGNAPGLNYAYFGPSLRNVQRFVASVCPTLNVASFPMGNVESIKFRTNHEAPTMYGGMVMDVVDQTSALMPIASIPGLLLPPFAQVPAIIQNMPWTHFKLMEESTVDPIQGMVLAQGRSDTTSEKTVEANGTVDVERYGGVLTAPGIVSVRGAGHTNDGKYLITGVSSDITPEHFKQTFTLNREGVGSTIAAVPPSVA